MSGKFIQKAIKHPGALHKELGIPADKKIPSDVLNKAAKSGGKLGQRARFALTLKKLHEASVPATPEERRKREAELRSKVLKTNLDAAARHKAQHGSSMTKSGSENVGKVNEENLQEDLHAYKVHQNGKHIDTIFYNQHQDPEDVKKSLVNHDGYDPNIKVTKERKKKMNEDVSIENMIGHVAGQNFAEATPLVQDILSQKVAGALDSYKQSIAHSLFGGLKD